MDFTHDDEQKALREAVRGLLARSYGSYEDRRRAVADEPGYDEKLWTGLAEMGVLGLPFSEEDGGMGAGPVETALVAEELGRVIAPEPFLTAVVLAGGLVAATGTADQRAELLGGLASGELLLAPAIAEPGRRWTSGARDVSAVQSDGGWALSGTKEPVPHGASAHRLVVTAALPDGGGTGVFLVEADAAGVTTTGYATHDGGRAARVELSSAPAVLLGEGPADVAGAVAGVVDAARVVACHQALGAMAVALEATTDYLKSRKQFGVPLSTFQALTFRAADMYVSLELARSVAAWASMVHAAGPDADADAGDAASRAALQVSRAGRHIGQEAIQLHGGIAMTAEYSVGNYTSHLTALDHLLGDGDHHLRALSATVADHAEVDPLP